MECKTAYCIIEDTLTDDILVAKKKTVDFLLVTTYIGIYQL